MLGAGLKGIEEKLPLEPSQVDNLYHLTEMEREQRGIKSLPGNLHEALHHTKRSSFVRECLGENLVDPASVDGDILPRALTTLSLRRGLCRGVCGLCWRGDGTHQWGEGDSLARLFGEVHDHRRGAARRGDHRRDRTSRKRARRRLRKPIKTEG